MFTYQSRTGDVSFLPMARRTLDWLSNRVTRIRVSGQEYQALPLDAGPGPAAVPSTKATAVCPAACRTAEVLTGEARYGVLASPLRRFLCDMAWDDRRGDVLVPVQRGHAASEPAGASCRNGRSAVGGCVPAAGMKPHPGGVT